MEVGMSGSHTGSVILKSLVTLTVAGVALAASPVPAEAHRFDGFGKERRHIRTRARTQLGAPYAYGGSSPGGFDCSGFTRWTFGGHGAALPHSSIEQFRLAKRSGYRRIWKRKNLRIGDLVFHKTTGAPVGHAGIYIGKGKFISSTSSSGVRVRSIWDPYYWGSRWVGATRVPATRNN
jgi:hypothetical protein